MLVLRTIKFTYSIHANQIRREFNGQLYKGLDVTVNLRRG